MDQLIDLALPGHGSDYYGRILLRALQDTGPVAMEGDTGDYVYSLFGLTGTPHPRGFRYSVVSKAGLTLVPADVLPYFRPENRGEEFPPDVPYVPLD